MYKLSVTKAPYHELNTYYTYVYMYVCMNVFCPCFQIYACVLLNLKGMSIAFAIAESLLDTGSMTLLVTHYPQITHLANLYPAVKNMHLKTSIDLSLSESGDEMPPRNHTAAATRAGWQYKYILTAGLCVVYVCMYVYYDTPQDISYM